MNDNEIIKYFSNYSRFLECLCTDEISQYLKNRFKDSDSLLESYLRIKNNIEIRPICPVCGKKVIFIGGKKMYRKHCSTKCSSLDKNVQNKSKETCINKYNVPYSFQSENNKIKSKQTKLERYGDENYTNRELSVKNTNYKLVYKHLKETNLKLYGYENPFENKEFIKRNTSKYSYIKRENTRRKNHTFNTSIPEKESYNLLKEKYSDVKYQYRSELYPFNCDFYIPNLDLYIECNYHWTHGGKPFENTKEDQQKLELWKSKNTKYYNIAIKTWTIRDIYKRNLVKQNNINWIEFWNINELKNWLND